jgi:hypothetical protein
MQECGIDAAIDITITSVASLLIRRGFQPFLYTSKVLQPLVELHPQ